ncbi:Protein GDAP2 -like protein [Escovopsis weberi]|uniref:Protein GDAP2-like protein n=1 Tax=Escovopsis weberi TaxID=150374 RepID=A0A0M8MZS7_ESCWE|nr:Protein GDAP2 -like protein [Escovopsis weberi]
MADNQDIAPDAAVTIAAHNPSPATQPPILGIAALPTIQDLYTQQAVPVPAVPVPWALPSHEYNAFVALHRGPITRIAADVLVVPTPAVLPAHPAAGSSTAAAVHRAAGPELVDALAHSFDALTDPNPSPNLSSSSSSTPLSGFRLPAPFVIHTVGPSYMHANAPAALPPAKKRSAALDDLGRCYAHAFQLADRLAVQRGACTLAFAAIGTSSSAGGSGNGSGTGKRGFPSREAAWVACRSARTYLECMGPAPLYTRIAFVVSEDEDYAAYLQAIP